jgi:hypothetical protein
VLHQAARQDRKLKVVGWVVTTTSVSGRFDIANIYDLIDDNHLDEL